MVSYLQGRMTAENQLLSFLRSSSPLASSGRRIFQPEEVLLCVGRSCIIAVASMGGESREEGGSRLRWFGPDAGLADEAKRSYALGVIIIVKL